MNNLVQACRTINELIEYRQQKDPFLPIFFDGADQLTIPALVSRARIVAGYLQAKYQPGERILIACQEGLAPIIGFFAAIEAGCIAVPVPAIEKKHDEHRRWSIIGDCKPVAILGRGYSLKTIDHSEGDLDVVDIDGVSSEYQNAWSIPQVSSSSPAFLQYTSGSIGKPKGVKVSHENLVCNLRSIEREFDLHQDDRAVMWLPLFHDMGLIGGMLQAVYTGYPVHFISPSSVARNPMSWLQMISSTRATISGGPNVTYELCARIASGATDLDLDLSSWLVAFNGAESVRATSLELFMRVFKRYGFRPSSLRPCYGLAEATLLVSCQNSSTGPHSIQIDRKALSVGTVQPVSEGEGISIVSMGRPVLETQVLIADPKTFRSLQASEIGEIWLTGLSITSGYWSGNNSDLFGSLAGDDSSLFMRTGDLGFIADDELYIVGRIKDVIVINGTNHHAEDIEDAINCCDPHLKANSATAFAITEEGTETLTIIQEVSRRVKIEDFEGIASTIRQRIMQDFGLKAGVIAFVKRNSIPRTSSGKKRRSACRDMYLSGSLNPLKILSVKAPFTSSSLTPEHVNPAAISEKDKTTVAAKKIKEFCSHRLGIPAEQIPANASLPQLGLDSLAAVELRAMLESTLSVTIPLDKIVSVPLSRLADNIVPRISQSAVEGPVDPEYFTDNLGNNTLSIGQKALWFLQQVEPGSDAYTIMRLIAIDGPLEHDALMAALSELGRRHPILRAAISERNGEPFQKVIDGVDIDLIDLNHNPGTSVATRVKELVSRNTVWDGSSLFKARLFVESPTKSTLFIAAHHMVVDLRSLLILLRELAFGYSRMRQRIDDKLPAISHYNKFIAWQSSLLASNVGDRQRRYWERSFARPFQNLRFSAASDRRTGSGGSRRFQIAQSTLEKVAQFARSIGCTVHSVFLSIYGILLHRYSGQSAFRLGIVSNGRTDSQFADVIGYFANLLPILVAVDDASTLRSVTEALYREIVDALGNQDIPYSYLVDKLRVSRSPHQTPLISAICMWQSVTEGVDGVTGFILGEAGTVYDFDNLKMRSLNCESQETEFELALTCVETSEGLECLLRYDSGCFLRETIDGMAENMIMLTEQVIGQPEQLLRFIATPVSDLSDESVCRENDTLYPISGECVHRQIQRTAARIAQRPAIAHRGETITFEELTRQANRIANYLNSLGIGPENRVGILAERSIGMVVGIIGVLSAGAAYVPLDPAYPSERLQLIIRESQASLVLSSRECFDGWQGTSHVAATRLDSKDILDQKETQCVDAAVPESLAYVMFTSGSTGKPKGVMVQHRNLINFFAGMDAKVGCNENDCLIAVTSSGFDISILELLWTLARGARVVIGDEMFNARPRSRPRKRKTPEVSLFYFADSATAHNQSDRYRLLIEGAKLADAQGFSAVWTPERHFHSFGGLYPNPAITSAALSTITKRVHIRGGSVVMPLHNPIRVAEDWAVIDNLSGGRAGIAVASGWHADDFVLNPDNYNNRKEIALNGIDLVRRLWRGETVRSLGGSGTDTSVAIYPRPLQREIPVWLTTSGSQATFMSAAQIKAHLLTHLLGQDRTELQKKLETYLSLHKGDRDSASAPIVSLMLHTYVDESQGQIRDAALKPFKEYLKSSVDLMTTFIKSARLALDIHNISDRDRDDLAFFAAERYMQDGGLFCTRDECCEQLASWGDIGVTEVACLIDFGVDSDLALQSLHRVADAARRMASEATFAPMEISTQDLGVTMMQCTPTYMKAMLSDREFRNGLSKMRIVLLGGEPVSPALASEVRGTGVGKIMNMYGPTETTVWSTASEMTAGVEKNLISGPIANTRIYLMNQDMRPVPIGAVGEIVIAGDGVSLGYIGDPSQTAERFLPDPFGQTPGARLYRTGDLGRRVTGGAIEMLGRLDQQVKIRGHRIELGEIEAALTLIAEIETAVVIVSKSERDLNEIAAFVVLKENGGLSAEHIQRVLKTRLPLYMIPSRIELVHELPVMANGKLDRARVGRDAADIRRTVQHAGIISPANGLEATVTKIWQDVLKVRDFSPDDNFFDVGGHSLLMAQVHRRLQDAVGKEFPLLQLLEAPTIHAMTRILERDWDEAALSMTEQANHERSALDALWQHVERTDLN